MTQRLFICFLAIGLSSSASAVLGSGWSNKTPGGNQMRNGAGVNLAPGVFIQNIDRWYFYKGHILGRFRTGSAQVGGYSASVDPQLNWFIGNEATGAYQTFTTEADWDEVRKRSGLVPLLVRWHDGDWHFLTNGYLVFMYSFIAVPLLLALVVIAVLLVRSEMVPWRLVFKVLAVVAAMVLSKVLLELYPQSI